MTYPKSTNDNYNFLGEGSGSIRWVKILHCPKDDPRDSVPMFTPGWSKFPLDQFVEGLRAEIWPPGMKVEILYYRYEGMGNGRHGRKKRRRYNEHKRYTIDRFQKLLIDKLEKEYVAFAQRAKEHFGETK